MQDYEKLGIFYLGHALNDKLQGEPGDLVLYESRDLLTHAVCIGMTGSGKTGLCLALIEEAVMDGIPVIAIDPKGDISNLLLTFPELSAQEFLPWVNEEDAKRKGESIEEFAAEEAKEWKAGLAESFQTGERIKKLRASSEFLIYTPGSTAGLPISILKSFEPPVATGDDYDEQLALTVARTASSLLALLGISADPLKSKEHILISNIFDTAWRKGEKLDINGLIHQIQKPPLDYIGALDIESFFPAKERFEFAMSLNNLIAAPSFQPWMKGEALDFKSLLYGPDSKPRVLIFSIAHLSDSERMFFVTLALNQTLGWMRDQSGTTSLRAIFYMDEIFGYFPPVANPPSKQPLLTLLKQARAFGVGVVLASQNPVDLDYKGLSNTGTWFIGRLQTERDKMRVLEGLEGAAAEAGSNFDRQRMEATLAGLGKRVFLLNNVHENRLKIFKSRFTMSYLRGPLARDQIKRLMDPVKQAKQSNHQIEPTETKSISASRKSNDRPALSPKINQLYVPPLANASTDNLIFEPRILGSMQLHFVDAKAGLDLIETRTFVVEAKDQAVPVSWDDAVKLKTIPEPFTDINKQRFSYGKVPACASNPENYKEWSKQAVTWATNIQKTYLLKSALLGEYSKPNETERDFRIRINHAMNEKRDAAIDELRKKYAPKIEKLEERIRIAQQKQMLGDQEVQLQQRDSMINAGATVFGAIMHRGLGTTTLNKAAQAAKSMSKVNKKKQELENSRENLHSLEESKFLLEQDINGEIKALQAKFDLNAEKLEAVAFGLKKTGVSLAVFGLCWLPYAVDSQGKAVPAW
jgi:hypothetical protein